jgi:uncharacterized lipoprotein YddW (UPF0748 family)
MTKKLSFLLLILFTSCGVFKPTIPQPRTEFRGVWIATVANIDWPKNGLDAVEKQKKDFMAMLDFYQELHFNAAIVQIRTSGDAFYASAYAPWSLFLTGEEGKAPATQEDILAWMIAETHNRGMEFHAWLNPYRATMNENTDLLSPTHDYHLHPDWMLSYGTKYYYNPGLPEVQEHLKAIMEEVVTTYDVDALHFDDYFYPYKIEGEVLNDSLTYKTYALPHQSIDDWRRSNVDSLVKKVHHTIKEKKPWVQFGISPFGVWKNKTTDPRGSDTQAGQTTYEDLYADPLLWMEQGWIDYVVPQVYWSMDLPVASHRNIVKWWSDHSKNTHLYIGNGIYKIKNNADTAWNRKQELPDQLQLARTTQRVNGNVFFSAKSLMQDKEALVEHLKRKFYKDPALPPASRYALKNDNPKLPTISLNKVEEGLQLQFAGAEAYRYALLYPAGRKEKQIYPLKKLWLKKHILDGNTVVISKEQMKNKKRIAITFIDKFGQETRPVILYLNKP